MPLYFDVRGLTTQRLHHRNTTSEITVDLAGHALTVRTSDGRNRSFGLGGGLTVAGSDARIHAVLSELGVDVHIKEQPFDAPDDHAIPPRPRARVVAPPGGTPAEAVLFAKTRNFT